MAAAFVLGTSSGSLAAQDLALAQLADTVFQAWNSTHTPGCAVGVARGERVLLRRGYGMADLETHTPITPETVFESGSVAKQFTAAAVILLATDGKLALDDPVQKYLPEVPQYERPITIRHLLTHTSGLREWSSLVAWQGWPRGTRAHTQADLLEILFRQKTLNYPPGEYYSYTNSGYALAMTLVERISGQSFQAFTHQRIFGPTGMAHTRWRDDFTRLIPGRAQAYRLEDDGWHLDMPFENVVGPGGLLTTVGDWLAWNQALTRKTLGAALTDSLTRRMHLTSGREISYALGLVVTEYRGVREISHSGSTAGYSTFLARYPDRGDLSIAVMCNAANATPAAYAHRLADRLVDDFPPPPVLDTAPVDQDLFKRYAGVYRHDRTHAPLVVQPDAPPRLRSLPDGWFWLPGGMQWRFETGSNGRPTALRVAQADGDTVRYTYAAAEPWKPSPGELQAFAGSYWSEELGVTYTATVVRDTLILELRPRISLPLRPVYPDAFSARGSTVWFSRDRAGRVTAMHISESRLWDLVLVRRS
jgi:CubicO group peptidase (beta-lactamase class C family)